MSVSDQFQTYDEMTTASEWIAHLERVTHTIANRSPQALGRNSDAILDALQGQRHFFMTFGGSGTGYFDWDGTTLTTNETLYLHLFNEIGGAKRQTIAAAGTAVGAGQVLYVQLDRETEDAVLTLSTATRLAFMSAITGDVDRLDYQILGYRDGDDFIFIDGRRVRSGERLDEDGSRDLQYARRIWQNASIQVAIGTSLLWTHGTGNLQINGDLDVYIPGVGYNRINNTTNATLTDGHAWYFVLDRAGGTTNITGTSATAAVGSVPMDQDVFVFAIRDGTDVILWDGQRVGPGPATGRPVETVFPDGGITDLLDDAGTAHLRGNVQIKNGDGITATFDETAGTVTITNTGILTLQKSGESNITGDVELVETSGGGIDIAWDDVSDPRTIGFAVEGGFDAMGDDIWENTRIFLSSNGTVGVNSAYYFYANGDIDIFCPGRFYNRINAFGAIPANEMGEGSALYVTLDRSVNTYPPASSLSVLVVGIDAVPDGEDIFVVATRSKVSGSPVILWNGQRLRSDEEADIGLSNNMEFSDLANCPGPLENGLVQLGGVTAAYGPATGNRVAVLSDLGENFRITHGGDFINVTGTNAVSVSPVGILVSGSYYEKTSSTTLTDADTIDGVSLPTDGWAFVYVGEPSGGVDGDDPEIGLSTTAPGDSGLYTYSGRDFQCLGVVRRAGGDFARSVQMGSRLRFLTTDWGSPNTDLAGDASAGSRSDLRPGSAESYALPAICWMIYLDMTIALDEASSVITGAPFLRWQFYDAAVSGNAVGDQRSHRFGVDEENAANAYTRTLSTEIPLPPAIERYLQWENEYLRDTTDEVSDIHFIGMDLVLRR